MVKQKKTATKSVMAPKAKSKALKAGASPLGAGFDFSQILDLLKNPAVMALIVAKLADLLQHSTKPVPVPPLPVPPPQPVPQPTPGNTDDDYIPVPPGRTSPTVAKVVARLQKVQFNKKRFPEMYTEQNPLGLADNALLDKYMSGQEAISYDSKVWLDATAYDSMGKELLADRIVAAGLSFQTEHHIGGAQMLGKGADKNGQPVAGYAQDGTNDVGWGITSWLNSLGFNAQAKMFGEGQFECYVKVGGVESEHFTIYVS